MFNWEEDIHYFEEREFTCKCGCGKNNINIDLVFLLDIIREEYKEPINISSGCRCEKHNEAEGGKETSSHLDGLAVDIEIDNSDARYRLVKLALEEGIGRIGIGSNFVHLDIDGRKPESVIWVY